SRVRIPSGPVTLVFYTPDARIVQVKAMTIGLEYTYRITDEAKEFRKKLHKALEQKQKLNAGHLIPILDALFELHEITGKKLDEIMERLVRLEDEIRKKPRPHSIARPKKKK
ncbi:MAG: hypothetical protein QXH80_04890, partial [Candidatus Nanoarchaeia archaeon]